LDLNALKAAWVSSPIRAVRELIWRRPKPLTPSANSFAATRSRFPDVELDELDDEDDELELLELEEELELLLELDEELELELLEEIPPLRLHK
jgi:hypothetical protein